MDSRGKAVGNHLLSDEYALPFTGRKNSDVVKGRIREGAPEVQLYDLRSDPRQEENVAPRHPEVVRKLAQVLAAYRREIPAGPELGWINLR